jgi:hypothetical protein
MRVRIMQSGHTLGSGDHALVLVKAKVRSLL